MTEIWESITLGETGKWLSGGTPKTTVGEYWGGDIPWISSKSLTEFRVRDADRRVTGLGAQNGTRLVPKNSILMVVRGMSLKTEFRMGITQREVAFGQDCKAILPGDGIDPTFLAYAIKAKSDEILGLVDEAGHGTGRLQMDLLTKVEIGLPPLKLQRAIAGLLGLIDDKLESNTRAAQKIDRVLGLAFEQVLATSEITDTPLGELVTLVKGVSYKSADLQPSRTSLVTLKSFHRAGGYKRDGLKPYVGPYKPAQVLAPGDLVVAQTDLTQGAEVVGRAVRVPADSSADTMVASLDLVIVRPPEDMEREYLFGVLADEAFRQFCRSRVTGTTVLHLASDAIPSYEAPVVPRGDQERFVAVARPLIERRDALDRETEALLELQRELLPQLVSGALPLPSNPRHILEAIA